MWLLEVLSHPFCAENCSKIPAKEFVVSYFSHLFYTIKCRFSYPVRTGDLYNSLRDFAHLIRDYVVPAVLTPLLPGRQKKMLWSKIHQPWWHKTTAKIQTQMNHTIQLLAFCFFSCLMTSWMMLKCAFLSKVYCSQFLLRLLSTPPFQVAL